jgi:hypothetical protein
MGILAFKNPAVEPTPYPHFKLTLLKEIGGTVNEIDLTNDFFVIKEGPVSIGNLLFPVVDPSNIIIRIGVQNLGPPISENARASFSFPKEFACAQSPAWADDEAETLSTLTIHIPNLLSGDGFPLPDIRFKPILLPSNNEYWKIACCFVQIRAKDSPTEEFAFNLIILPVSNEGVNLMPSAEPSKIVNGKSVLDIPPEMVKFLKR